MNLKENLKNFGESVSSLVSGVVKLPRDIQYIREKNEEIESVIAESNKKIDPIREELNKKLEALGKVKVEILETTISEFTALMSKIENLPFDGGLSSNSHEEDFSFSKKEFDSMAISVISLKKLLAKTTGAVGSGVASAGALYAAVAAFGTASTGTLISSVSGAAASNATLAWLGGGVLSVGGGGVALGATVLGGIALVPAVSYLIWKGKFNYADEREEVDKRFEEAIEYATSIDKIIKNFRELARLIENTILLINRFSIAVNQLNKQTNHIIAQIGDDFNKYSDKQQFLIQKHIAFALELGTLLETPIMKEDGAFNEKMLPLLHQSNQFLRDFGEIEFIDFTQKVSVWSYALPTITFLVLVSGYLYYELIFLK